MKMIVIEEPLVVQMVAPPAFLREAQIDAPPPVEIAPELLSLLHVLKIYMHFSICSLLYVDCKELHRKKKPVFRTSWPLATLGKLLKHLKTL